MRGDSEEYKEDFDSPDQNQETAMPLITKTDLNWISGLVDANFKEIVFI